MYVENEKKMLERNALEAFLQDNCKLRKYTIEDGERPDFILTKDEFKIGIEHFRADTILNEYTDSESMKHDGQRKAIFKKHNRALLSGEFDVAASANDIETFINKSLDATLKFDYNVFVKNLESVFEQHADKVSEYKKKCNEVWFLIDIGIENNYFTGLFDNGGRAKTNVLPITGDMLNIFSRHKDINRVMVCSRYLGRYKIVYDSGRKTYGYKFRSFNYIPISGQIKLDIKK